MSRTQRGIPYKLPSPLVRRMSVRLAAEHLAAIKRIREDHPSFNDADALRYGVTSARRTPRWERVYRTVGVLYIEPPGDAHVGGGKRPPVLTLSLHEDDVQVRWDRPWAGPSTRRVLTLVFRDDADLRYTREWGEGVQVSDVVRTDDHLRELWAWVNG